MRGILVANRAPSQSFYTAQPDNTTFAKSTTGHKQSGYLKNHGLLKYRPSAVRQPAHCRHLYASIRALRHAVIVRLWAVAAVAASNTPQLWGRQARQGATFQGGASQGKRRTNSFSGCGCAAFSCRLWLMEVHGPKLLQAVHPPQLSEELLTWPVHGFSATGPFASAHIIPTTYAHMP